MTHFFSCALPPPPPPPPPVQNSIHAKFDVSEGPSSPQQAVVKFVCDGSTLSGADVELGSAGYKVSLLKKKFSSGIHTANPSVSPYTLHYVCRVCMYTCVLLYTYIHTYIQGNT